MVCRFAHFTHICDSDTFLILLQKSPTNMSLKFACHLVDNLVNGTILGKEGFRKIYYLPAFL